MDTEKLIDTWIEAKRLEDIHKAKRQTVAAELAAMLGHPEEGSKTHTVGEYKVTLKGTINHKVDWELYDSLFMSNSDKHPPHVEKRELDSKGVRYYRENEPSFYRALAECITAKPGVVGVTIK